METLRIDAGYGVLMEGNGKGQFTSRLPNESGLFVKGDVKNAMIENTPFNDKKRIIFGKNDGVVQFVEY